MIKLANMPVCLGLRIQLNFFQVNFPDGKFEVKSSEDEILLKICRSFAASTLYLLVITSLHL